MSNLLTKLKWWLMAPWLLTLLVMATPAAAQVSGPSFVFIAGTVINPDEVNTNFADVYDAALNRFGGTVEGHLLWSPDGTFDIGASGTSRPRDLFLQRDATIGGGVTATALASSGNTTIGGTLGVTGATTLAALSATTGTFSSTLGVTGASTLAALSATTGSFSSTLGVTGATTLGSTLGVTGASTLAALSATTGSFSSTLGVTGATTLSSTLGVSGVSTLAALSATTGVFSSTLNVVGTITAAAAGGTINIRPNAGSDGYLTFTENAVADRWALGIDDASGSLRGRLLTATGTIAFEWDASGNFVQNFGHRWTGVISPAALTNGNNNDYAPAGLSTASVLRVTSGGGSTTLTGLAALSGYEIKICSIGFVDIPAESVSSSAANRFASAKTLVNGCVDAWYDPTSSRWRIEQ